MYKRQGHGGAAGVGAVFSRACPALADALHHALLHGAGSLAHGIPVVGQPDVYKRQVLGRVHGYTEAFPTGQLCYLFVCTLAVDAMLFFGEFLLMLWVCLLYTSRCV